MAQSNFKLFTITPQTSKWQGAPRLVANGSGLINIKDDYSWTISPKGARAEIPSIVFKEYELDLSSLITSALYKLRGGIENVQALNQNVNSSLSRLTNSLSPAQIAALTNTASDVLNPYAGMYAASPTGFEYTAPYLEPLNQDINNQWGDDHSNVLDSRLGNIVKEAGEAVASILNTTNLANIAATGSYAEKPKFFNPGTSDAYTVRFPLLNTMDPTDIVKNWELCYLLTYQNLANRRSVNLLDPPALYHVTIPGIRQSPMSYISKLTIQHVGNIRNMDIYNDGRMKPIPEAYMVSITFQDLLNNSRNIFKYALDEQTVVASVATGRVTEPLRTTLNNGTDTPTR